MFTYFHIFTHHIYIHFSDSESLKWLAFSIGTILLFFTLPSFLLIAISNSFWRIHRIEIGILCGAQTLTTGGARRRWVQSCVSSGGSSLSFTSWSTLEAPGFHIATHTHTHMEHNPGRQDFTTHTRTHTPHTVTHARTHWCVSGLSGRTTLGKRGLDRGCPSRLRV